MKTYPLTFLEIGILTGARAVAGAGLGVLLAGKATPEQRKAIGWSLFGIGTVFFLALLADLLLRNRDFDEPKAD